jgi:DNA-directed RNA polymerase specialized sigma24 family protein
LRLVRLAVQLVDDQASAEDVVQDVFARLQQGQQNLHELADLRRYLTTAVVNQARSTLRQRRLAPAL